MARGLWPKLRKYVYAMLNEYLEKSIARNERPLIVQDPDRRFRLNHPADDLPDPAPGKPWQAPQNLCGFQVKGAYVWIGAAKNDPRKKGRELYVPRSPGTELCAVAALDRWLARVGAAGPVFRTFDLRGQLTENRLTPETSRAFYVVAHRPPVQSATLPGIRCGAVSSRTWQKRRSRRKY